MPPQSWVLHKIQLNYFHLLIIFLVCSFHIQYTFFTTSTILVIRVCSTDHCTFLRYIKYIVYICIEQNTFVLWNLINTTKISLLQKWIKFITTKLINYIKYTCSILWGLDHLDNNLSIGDFHVLRKIQDIRRLLYIFFLMPMKAISKKISRENCSWFIYNHKHNRPLPLFWIVTYFHYKV